MKILHLEHFEVPSLIRLSDAVYLAFESLILTIFGQFIHFRHNLWAKDKMGPASNFHTKKTDNLEQWINVKSQHNNTHCIISVEVIIVEWILVHWLGFYEIQIFPHCIKISGVNCTRKTRFENSSQSTSLETIFSSNNIAWLQPFQSYKSWPWGKHTFLQCILNNIQSENFSAAAFLLNTVTWNRHSLLNVLILNFIQHSSILQCILDSFNIFWRHHENCFGPNFTWLHPKIQLQVYITISYENWHIKITFLVVKLTFKSPSIHSCKMPSWSWLTGWAERTWCLINTKKWEQWQ